METLSFVLKTTIVTVAVILIMQIKWGQRTIEDHAMNALTSSTVVRPLNEAAGDAVIFAQDTWGRFIRSFHNDPGYRHFIPSELTHRSQAAQQDSSTGQSN